MANPESTSSAMSASASASSLSAAMSEITIPSSLKFLMSNLKNIVSTSLTNENYPIWHLQVFKLFSANGFEGYLTGAVAPPEDSESQDLRIWKMVEVEFSDGSSFNFSAEFLRVYSPAVDSKIRSVGGEKVIFGRRHVGIMSAEPIGNYGIRILFDDLHKTGIYTWDYFYHLGSKKFSLMRSYIKTLKQHGLSRDPQRRK